MVELARLEELRDFDTALLANTIGYIDSTPPEDYYLAGDIQSVTPTLGPTVGIAMTCELDSSTPGNKADTDGYWQQLDEIAQCKLPVVWVVKAVGSRPDHECILGDGNAKTLYSVGCIGAVTDGRVRDVAGILTTPLAVYCRGTTVHHVALRFTARNRPVEIGGVTIRSGDVIHANAEGVIRIPTGCIDQLPEAAVRMRSFEHHVHQMFRRTDLSLADKRKAMGDTLAKFGFGKPAASQGR
jgi:4-hydroxy-4-methyl-2-oxoglutarate aldolase